MIRNKPYSDDTKPIIYLVATPIGNIEDITLRAIRILKEADIICCEDTRNTSLLLKRLNIENKKIYSLYAQNEKENSKEIIRKIKEEKLSLCYLSDAGMPGISDPGSILVKEAYSNDVKVSVLPGLSAVISSLVISSLDTSDFSFYGFLPTKENAKRNFLSSLAYRKETLIFYESPNRIKETINIAKDVFSPERKACIVREISKIHEEVISSTLEELSSLKEEIKGEIVFLIEGTKEKEVMSDKQVILLLKEGIKEEKLSSLTKRISQISNRDRKEIYNLALKLKGEDR